MSETLFKTRFLLTPNVLPDIIWILPPPQIRGSTENSYEVPPPFESLDIF